MAIRIQYKPSKVTQKHGLKSFRVTHRGVRVIDPRRVPQENAEKGLLGNEFYQGSFSLTFEQCQVRVGQVFLVWEPKVGAWLPAIITATGKDEGEAP